MTDIKGDTGKQGKQCIQREKGDSMTTQITHQINRFSSHINVQLKYIVFFFLLFTLMSSGIQGAANIYYIYYDKTQYYKITSPVPVEKKENELCSYVDAYIHRVALAPIYGTSIRQLTLIRKIDGKKERIASYTTDIQADLGEDTIIAHWLLPCTEKEAPFGSYQFEGTVQYQVFGTTRYEHFFTENFDIIATPSGILQIQ